MAAPLRQLSHTHLRDDGSTHVRFLDASSPSATWLPSSGPQKPSVEPLPKKPRTLDAFLAAPAPAPAAPPPTQVDEPAVAQITSMGFSRKRALAALGQANGDVPRALERLLS